MFPSGWTIITLLILWLWHAKLRLVNIIPANDQHVHMQMLNAASQSCSVDLVASSQILGQQGRSLICSDMRLLCRHVWSVKLLCVFQVWQTGRTMRFWRRCWPSLSRSTWTAWNTRAPPCTERESRPRTAADSQLTHTNTHKYNDDLWPPLAPLHHHDPTPYPAWDPQKETDQGKK